LRKFLSGVFYIKNRGVLRDLEGFFERFLHNLPMKNWEKSFFTNLRWQRQAAILFAKPPDSGYIRKAADIKCPKLNALFVMSAISSISAVSDPFVSASIFTVGRQQTEISQSSGSSASASSSRTIAILQQQLMLYTQFANGTGPAAAAYKALEYAIQTNNVSDAQAAMAQLQSNSESAGASSSATTTSDSSISSDIGQSASSGQTPELGSINVTA
jgi:hypothetical protein